MWNSKRTILIVMVSWMVVVPVCLASADAVVSGRELLQAVRQRDSRRERPVRRDRGAYRTAKTSRRKGDGDSPSAKELLDKYAETQDKLQSFIIKSRDLSDFVQYSKSNGGQKIPELRGRTLRVCEFRFDGKRLCLRYRRHDKLSPSGAPRDKGVYISNTYDGNYLVHFHVNDELLRIYGEPKDAREQASDTIEILYRGREVMGYFSGDYWLDGNRIDAVLRRAKRISVRDRMEPVGRSECYVIDAESPRGNYTVWIDPKHGYNIAKAEVFRGPRQCDAIYEERYKGKVKSCSASITNVRFKKIEGVWVPVEADAEKAGESIGGRVRRGRHHHKRTEVILNPDHEALRSFYPDDIPSGWLADNSFFGSCPEREGGPDLGFEDAFEYRWVPKARFVANENCRVVRNDPDKHILPIVKVLPVLSESLGDFQLKPVPSGVRRKHIILCFWDINQQQSRELLLSLRDRQKALAQNGILLIAVEASGAQTDKVRSWAEGNKLTFPVGAFYGRFERFLSDRRKDLDPGEKMDMDDRKKKTVLSNLATDLRTIWTVEKLPWFVLTDRDRVVTAEGFGLEELDDKIKENEDVEQ